MIGDPWWGEGSVAKMDLLGGIGFSNGSGNGSGSIPQFHPESPITAPWGYAIVTLWLLEFFFCKYLATFDIGAWGCVYTVLFLINFILFFLLVCLSLVATWQSANRFCRCIGHVGNQEARGIRFLLIYFILLAVVVCNALGQWPVTVEGTVTGALGMNLGSLGLMSVQGVMDNSPQDESAAAIVVAGIGKILVPL